MSTLTAAREVATDRVFRLPDRLSFGEFEQTMDEFNDRLTAAVGPGGIAIDRLPLGPFGGTLADLGYSGVTSPTPGGGSSLAGHEYGMSFLKAGLNAASRGPLMLKDTTPPEAKPEPPDFPGFDAPVGQIINWANFYRGVKAKFPDELSFGALKEQAKNFLIEQGVKFLEEQLKRLAVDGVMALLGPAMDDAMATAAKAGGGLLDQIGGLLNDPLGTIQGALLSALPNLAGKGTDALLGGLFGDDAKLSPGELVAKMAAKEMLSGMSAALMEGVGSFEELAANFENLQDKLYGQLRKYFTGGEFTPGKATMPLARVADKDDKVDAVASGCATVIAEGMAAARLTDPLTPSGQVIAIGSETVLIGGLHAARQGSLTGVVSAMATGAAQVLVEGATRVSVTADGAPFCVPDAKSAAAAAAGLTKGAAGAAAGGAGGGSSAQAPKAPPAATKSAPTPAKGDNIPTKQSGSEPAKETANENPQEAAERSAKELVVSKDADIADGAERLANARPDADLTKTGEHGPLEASNVDKVTIHGHLTDRETGGATTSEKYQKILSDLEARGLNMDSVKTIEIAACGTPGYAAQLKQSLEAATGKNVIVYEQFIYVFHDGQICREKGFFERFSHGSNNPWPEHGGKDCLPPTVAK